MRPIKLIWENGKINVKGERTIRGIKRYLNKAIDCLYPPCCPVCDRVLAGMDNFICKGCREKLVYVTEPACKICGKPILYENGEKCGDCENQIHQFIQNKAVFVYQKEMKQSMYRFKYANKREYAEFYVQEALNRYKNWILDNEIELIVPVPLHKSRKRKRGYNQAQLLGAALSRESGIPMDTKLLQRVKKTKPQKELNEIQRKKNLKSAFKTSVDRVQLKKILLVDDIYTTGSTLDAAAAAVRHSGVEHVYALCICIGQTY